MKVFLAGNFPTIAGGVTVCAAAYRAYVDGMKIYLCEAGGVADGYAKNVEDEERPIFTMSALCMLMNGALSVTFLPEPK